MMKDKNEKIQRATVEEQVEENNRIQKRHPSQQECLQHSEEEQGESTRTERGYDEL